MPISPTPPSGRKTKSASLSRWPSAPFLAQDARPDRLREKHVAGGDPALDPIVVSSRSAPSASRPPYDASRLLAVELHAQRTAQSAPAARASARRIARQARALVPACEPVHASSAATAPRTASAGVAHAVGGEAVAGYGKSSGCATTLTPMPITTRRAVLGRARRFRAGCRRAWRRRAARRSAI